jgi:hypothetical protein
VKLTRLRRPKIVCSPSYEDFRPKIIILFNNCSNIMGYGLHTKGRMHTGGIGKGKETQNLKVFDVSTIEEIIK